jgi:hypothetical protein
MKNSESWMSPRGLNVLSAAAIVCGLSIFSVTAIKWPGSFHTYAAMSLALWGLLAVGVRHLVAGNVGFSLLAMLLWVGYWVKLSVHLVFGTPWVEPIGRFDSSAQNWDAVATVSATGAFGVALVGLLSRTLGGLGSAREIDRGVSWKPGARIFAYLFISAAVVAIVVVNESYGISHNGLRPAVDLVWPFQGLFNWLFVIGITLLILTAFHVDALSGNSMIVGILVFVAAVTLLAISQYSRGIAALQSLPLAMTLLLLWRRSAYGMTSRRTIALLVVLFIGVMVSVAGGQERRIQGLPNYQLAEEDSDTHGLPNTHGLPDAHGLPVLLSRLAIDRWVGLEGIMAVVAYPDKGMSFFKDAIGERRTKDKVDTYTGVISQAGAYDTSKYHFATIPGAFAFLYYSSSLSVVFLGALFLAAIVIASEHVVRVATNNVFVSSQVGFFTAMLFIQLGAGGLVQPASVLIFTLVCAILISLGGKSLLTLRGAA